MSGVAAVAVMVLAIGARAQDPAFDARAARVDPYVEKQRVVVMTDIANEPDDQMSMVRFLVYANQFDVEGLIATTSTWMKNKVRPDVIQMLVGAYDAVRPKLSQHQPGFPTASALSSVIVAGQPGYGMAAVGPDKMSPGAELIIRAAERSDPRPLWVLAWGGTNTLAQALLHAKATKTAAELDALVAKLRVYTISDQDDAGPWLRREFPALHYIGIPSTPDGDQYVSGHLDRHQRRSLLQERARRRLHDVHRRLGEPERAQQGTARKALPDALLHSRRRYAGISRPDQQRPGELHEPGLWRMERPLRVANLLRRAAPVLDPGRRFVSRPRQLQGHRGRPGWPGLHLRPGRRSGAGGPRSSTTSRRGWTGRSKTWTAPITIPR